MTLRSREKSQELKEAEEKLRHAVMEVLQNGGHYSDIEDAVQDGIVIAENTWKLVTIEGS